MNNSMVDVWVMLAFGLLGLRLENAKVPLAPLILGMILGPKVEVYLRQGLIAANGDVSAIVASTVSMVMSFIFILTVLLTLSRQLVRKRMKSFNANKLLLAWETLQHWVDNKEVRAIAAQNGRFGRCL